MTSPAAPAVSSHVDPRFERIDRMWALAEEAAASAAQAAELSHDSMIIIIDGGPQGTARRLNREAREHTLNLAEARCALEDLIQQDDDCCTLHEAQDRAAWFIDWQTALQLTDNRL